MPRLVGLEFRVYGWGTGVHGEFRFTVWGMG